MTNAIAPIVSLKANQIVASSKDVADFFGKAHRNVLRDIDALLTDAPGASLNFELCSYQASAGGRNYRAFDMTRDGFTLLAMGFTGSKALQFKLRYIAAFNEMEAKLKAASPDLPNFSNPAEAARAWAAEFERKQIAEQKLEAAQQRVKEMEPKEAFYDVYADMEGVQSFTVVAKLLGIAPRKFTDWLQKKYVYRTTAGHLVPRASHPGPKEIFDVKTTILPTRTQVQTRITAKGVLYFTGLSIKKRMQAA